MYGIDDRLKALGERVLGIPSFGSGASIDSLPAWTSLKHIMLLGEVAEEFGIDIELEEAYRLDSFDRLREYVASRTSAEISSIGALFHARALAHGDRPFLIFPKEEAGYDYAAFHRLASAAAKRLEDAGLGRGDRLCLVFPNGAEFLAYYFAAHLLGIVLVPVNPALSAAEMDFIISNSGARLGLFDRNLADVHAQLTVAAIRLELADGASGFGLGSLAGDRDVVPRAPLDEIGLDDVAVVLYTSGTTGNPKGVVLSHRNFLADATALVDWFAFAPGTRTLCILPLFHNNGQVITVLSPLWVGGSSVIVEAKSALTSFWKLIDTYQVQWTSVMPAFLSTFLEYRLKRHDTTLRGIVCGGQVLLDEVRARFESEYGVAVFEGYGLTETTSFSSLNGYPAERRVFGSIGRALPCNQMMVADADGCELPVGETGEILIRGDNVAIGYHDLPEITRQRFRDGWLHTGDYGRCDGDGNFYFATRLDDMIIKGGENIYPAELENVLHTMGDVVECAAFGIPDPILGQDICVYAKLCDGSSIRAEDVLDYFKGRLAQFKHPRHVVIINKTMGMSELPKGPTRKILRRELERHFSRNEIEVA